MSSDPERAANAWRKAEAHLQEALAQSADASPMAIIHSGYYAMFHAARAVLFQANGSAPRRHDQTIQQFGLLVRDLDEDLRAAGRTLNQIKDERNDADYNETVIPSAQEGRDALNAASSFLRVCGVRYGFRSWKT